jgi:hypothetical protein
MKFPLYGMKKPPYHRGEFHSPFLIDLLRKSCLKRTGGVSAVVPKNLGWRFFGASVPVFPWFSLLLLIFQPVSQL